MVGPSRIRVEDLYQWLWEVTHEEYPDVTNKENVVTLVQAEFRVGYLGGECSWNMVVMIPKKDGKELQGIRLVYVLWKATNGIINRRLTAEITYHHIIHGFCTGCGTGTAILEANILHQMTSMREAVLHTI